MFVLCFTFVHRMHTSENIISWFDFNILKLESSLNKQIQHVKMFNSNNTFPVFTHGKYLIKTHKKYFNFDTRKNVVVMTVH